MSSPRFSLPISTANLQFVMTSILAGLRTHTDRSPEDQDVERETAMDELKVLAPRDAFEGVLSALVILCFHNALDVMTRPVAPEGKTEQRARRERDAMTMTRSGMQVMRMLESRRARKPVVRPAEPVAPRTVDPRPAPEDTAASPDASWPIRSTAPAPDLSHPGLGAEEAAAVLNRSPAMRALRKLLPDTALHAMTAHERSHRQMLLDTVAQNVLRDAGD